MDRFLSKIAYFLFITTGGVITCVSANLNKTSNHSIHIVNHGHIPLLSVSMNVDPKNYIARLIKSIDFPVQRLIVQIGVCICIHKTFLLSPFYNPALFISNLGNKDHKVVRKIVKSIKEAMSENALHVTSVEFNLLDFNPGSAKGFNFGLRTMMRCMGLSFRHLIAADILTCILQVIWSGYSGLGVDCK